MGMPANSAALQQLLLSARQSLKAAQPERAAELADAALKLDQGNALAHFLAGNARAALSQHAAAAAAFRRVCALTADEEPGSHRHQLHVTATDNMLLEAERCLPPCWVPALHDAPRLAALEAAIQAAVAAAGQARSSKCEPTADMAQRPAPSGTRVLVIGGLGVEAVLAAKAGAAAVVVYCEGNPLEAELAAELAADSGCHTGSVVTTTAAEQLAGHGPFDLVILPEVLGSSIDWQQLRRSLGAVASRLAPSAAMLPHTVRMCGQVVQSAAAVALNEVDVPLLRADTGGLDLGPANRLLPRSSRSICLPAHPYTELTPVAELLSVPLASLLPSSGNSALAAEAVAAAPAHLPVITSGNADALAWWYEQQVLPPGTPACAERAALSSSPQGMSAEEAQLAPHVWQHLQYLSHCQLAAGQGVDVLCTLGGLAGAPSAGAAGDSADAASEAVRRVSLAQSGGTVASSALDVQLDVCLAGSRHSMLLPVPAEQGAIAAAVPRYHTSMLNDSVRTAAYRDGIAAAMKQATARTAPAAEAGDNGGSGSGCAAPLVLEVGSGSGLLCLLACQAGARRIVGCERLPELQTAAAQLLAANGVADRVTILPKHSRELTVAGTLGQSAETSGQRGGQQAQQQRGADLPRKADLLMHEIFGTDPFSEGVVPSVLHARQHLLAPNATLAPCSVRVVAAVAASPTQHRLTHPPATLCGGAVALRALRTLAPRKVDCQAGHAGQLYLLTEPAAVLEVDLAAPDLELADSATALLECLPQPLPLTAWMAAQQAGNGSVRTPGGRSGDASTAAAAVAEGGAAGASGAPLPAALAGASLFAVSWFEYEFPSGVVGSTAPHIQLTEHWQQVVQPLGGDAADAVMDILSGSGSDCDNSSGGGGAARDLLSSGVGGLLLTTGYRVDRLWFELEALAAVVDGSEDEEGEAEADA